MAIFARLGIWAGSFLSVAMIALAAQSKSELPNGFVYLRDLAPAIVQDLRYAGLHNFVGRPIPGYDVAECILTERAARALSDVQVALAAKGSSLIVWDCYRPTRAVAAFVRWTMDAADERMKTEFYPKTDKRRLIAFGYLAMHSAHSRGSTVDVGIVPAVLRAPPRWDVDQPLKPCTAPKGERFDDGTVDLGTGYDCLNERARYDDRSVGETARANRALLRDLMIRCNFKPYWREWWHFELADEPFPGRLFDFSVR